MGDLFRCPHGVKATHGDLFRCPHGVKATYRGTCLGARTRDGGKSGGPKFELSFRSHGQGT